MKKLLKKLLRVLGEKTALLLMLLIWAFFVAPEKILKS